MKKVLFAFAVATVFAACNDNGGTTTPEAPKVDTTKKDTAATPAPVAVDTTKKDTAAMKPVAPAADTAKK